MIERRFDGQKGRFRIEICPGNNRDEETLVELIRKHVAPDSNIESDGWASYANLDRHGYRHRVVIHDTNFVDPETGCHTQTIEASWRVVKHRIGRGGIKDLAMHLCEFLFMKEMKRIDMDYFDGLIVAIAIITSLENE